MPKNILLRQNELFKIWNDFKGYRIAYHITTINYLSLAIHNYFCIDQNKRPSFLDDLLKKLGQI